MRRFPPSLLLGLILLALIAVNCNLSQHYSLPQIFSAANQAPSATPAPALRPTRTPLPPTLTPTPVPTFTMPVPVQETLPPVTEMEYSTCDQLEVMADVTVPDGMLMKPGEIFLKIWRVKNTGACAWDDRYRLVFFQGDALGGPSATNAYFFDPDAPLKLDLGGWPERRYTVQPGETADLVTVLQAPDEPGYYRSNWILANADNQLVNALIWAQVAVEESAARPREDWSGAWTLPDPYITAPVTAVAALNQDQGSILGFFYNYRHELVLISGAVNPIELSVEGEYGEPRQLKSIPFKWKMLPNKDQFQGIFWLGPLSANPWCGGRNGRRPPDPCTLP